MPEAAAKGNWSSMRGSGMRFAGKTVVVAGAGASAEGLSNGQAAAVLYAREGAAVFAVDAVFDQAERTREMIESEGGTAEACVADIADEPAVQAAVAACLKRFGAIDVLHNNVGIIAQGGVTTLSVDDWRRLIDVNLSGAFLLCRHILPSMKRGGAVVNISSLAATRVAGVPHIAYGASKAGLVQMSREMAVEFAPKGIRVNTISPGAIASAVALKHWASLPQKAEERSADASPMRRFGSPWEVAKAALFLASDDASFVTGADLTVDGGLSCR